MSKNLLDLTDELLARILEFCFFIKKDAVIKKRSQLCLSSKSILCHAPQVKPAHLLKTIQTLCLANKRISQILRRKVTYRDLKVLHLASDTEMDYDFYPNKCTISMEEFVPEDIISLAQSLSKFHPVNFKIETESEMWYHPNVTPELIDVFIELLYGFKGHLSIQSIQILVNHVDKPYYDESRRDRKRALFADLVKAVQAASTEGDGFYVDVVLEADTSDDESSLEDESFEDY